MMTALSRLRPVALALGTMLLCTAAQAEVLFWSTLAQPVEEAQMMRENVLGGFAGGADYQASEGGLWLTRLQAELQAGSGTLGVLGGLHGDLTSATAGLFDLTGVGDTSAIPALTMDFGKLGTSEQKYLPWMQATFPMVANRKALEGYPACRSVAPPHEGLV